MTSLQSLALNAMNLAGVAAFGVNGALTALRSARLDLAGALILGSVTALGGGTIRDVIMGHLPPTTFVDWRYLLAAGLGSLVAFWLGRHLVRYLRILEVADALGLSLFCATGAQIALQGHLGAVQAVLLGVVSATGGGLARDVLVRQVPTAFSEGLYLTPAALGAALTVAAEAAHVAAPWPLVVGALGALTLRLLAVKFRWNAPRARFGPS